MCPTPYKAILFLLMLSLAGLAQAQQVCPGSLPVTAPASEFDLNGDGTVTHLRTGLMWKQCVEGRSGVDCADGIDSLMAWREALQLAEAHEFAGYDDWRLPNVKEFLSILELSCHNPAIDPGVFPNVANGNHWTQSPYISDSNFTFTWTVEFMWGRPIGATRTNGFRVRLVRDITPN